MPEPSAHRLEDLIGNTPLVRLCKIEKDAPGVEIYGKAEFFNPGGSVKDRPALNMILEGEKAGAFDARQDHPGCHFRQHRHRVCHDRRGAGLQSAPVPAPERLAGAQKDTVKPTARRLSIRRLPSSPTGPFARSKSYMLPTLSYISTRTNTATMPIGRHTTKRPARRFGRRPRAVSRILSPVSARPGP